MTQTRQFFIFFTLFGIFHSVFCENYSVNPFSFQLNKNSDLESTRFPKENVLENPVQDKINERRRLFFSDDMNSAINAEREEENNNYSPRRRSNFSQPENEKMFNWGNVRLQIPLPVNPENSRNFADHSVKQHFLKEKNLNQRYDWEKRSDIFEKGQSRWNEEKNFKEFPNQDLTTLNYYNGRVGEVVNDSEMNREDRRGDIFDRRISITTLNDAEVRKMKNYNDERVGDIHSGHMGHSSANYYNENRNNFWNPNLFKPEKGVVINLKTECSTPRQFNNQLVHKFFFTPKSPISTQSEFSGFQIPESGFISSHKMTPMYYL